jgi:ATP-binding cassette, subfamily C, bacteriocin exporter
MNFLYNLKKSKTIIIVSHRINTLKKVDKLYILKNGSVLQKRGSGNLVSSKKKLFTKILNSKK